MPILIRAGGVGGLALTVVVWAVPVASDDGLPPLSELCAAVVVAADRNGVDLGRLLQLESLPEVMPDDEWQECRIAVFAHMNAGFRGAMREAEREAMEFQREVEARQRAERACKIAACQSSGGEWRDRAAGSYCVPREQVEARKRALEEMEHRRAERERKEAERLEAEKEARKRRREEKRRRNQEAYRQMVQEAEMRHRGGNE